MGSLANGTTVDLITSNYAMGRKTYIIPLTFPDITAGADVLERISYGGDIWEVRVDLLQPSTPPPARSIPPLDYVASQIDFLQQATSLPILFTIRTTSHGGRFPDDAHKEALELMLMAVDKNCAYIDVELTWPSSMIKKISSRKRTTRLVASFHSWTGDMKWTDPRLENFAKTHEFGLSILSTDISDCHELALFVRNYRKRYSKPILAVGMGQPGQLSRVTSPISLVTHPLIPMPSAPGQLSLAQVHQCLHLIGELPRRNFYIFGNNIAHSLSPTIHNVAFAELGLPHLYSIHETVQIDDSVRQMLYDPTFGGASVTYPHKLNIQPMLDSISESARSLGAVNTVVVEDAASGRKLRGENTDWLGILRCVQKSKVRPHQRATVVGAGGAARAAVFALYNLGVHHIAIVNRTRRHAERMAVDFASLRLEIYESLAEVPPANLIISCIPADDVEDEDIPVSIFAEEPGVVIEMAYRPPVTAIMRVTSQRDGWTVMSGVDVLKEQAFAQFEIWTGRRAPVLAIQEALDAQIRDKSIAQSQKV